MSMKNTILPSSVTSINLKSRLQQFKEDEHLLNIADLTKEYFSKQKEKNSNHLQSPETLKLHKEWEIFGRPMTRGVASYEEVKQIVKSGSPDTFMGLIPNDIINGIPLWNRTDKINFTNAWSHLDKIGGMDWDSLYIVVAYFQGKFITLIGNHCIVKTIVMCGYGALIPCKIIYVGDTESDMEKFMSRKHDIDSNKRTNQNPVDRLVSQARSGDKEGEKKMKTLISLGYNVKGQVLPNGKDLVNVTSENYILDYVGKFGYDKVSYVSDLVREVWEGEQHHSFTIGVFTQTYFLFEETFRKHSKTNSIEGSDIFKSFLQHEKDSGTEQSDFIVGSTNEKSELVHSVRLVSKLNRFCKSNYALKAGFPRLGKVLISRNHFVKKLNDEDIPSNINEL